MNILRTIKMDIEKFLKGTGTRAEAFANAFVKLFKKVPSALQTVENFLQMAAPVLVAATELVDPVAEPEVAGALALCETGLAAIQAAATAATSGTSLLSNLENFATTVPALLEGIAIKNPELKSTITKFTNLAVSEAKVLIPAVTAWVAEIKATRTPAGA